MSIIQGVGSGEVSGNFYPFEIDQSCRFDDASNDFLSRTFSAGNQKTFTYSCWVKLAALGTSRTLLARHDAGNNTFVFRFDDSNNLQVENFVGSYQLHLVTDAEFRDIGAWYNVVLRIDTTQSTDTDRARLYVNGTEQTSFSSSVYPSQDADLKVNAAASHIIGARSSGSFNFDGYLADVNFIDGVSLAPTSFGELKEDIWVPIDTSSLNFASGANGFRLQFQDSSSLGDDTGGQTHDFSVTGLTSADQMTDSPTNNHPTLGPQPVVTHTLSDGNLKSTNSSGTHGGTTATFNYPTSGKWYHEVTINAEDSSAGNGVGIGNQISRTSTTWGNYANLVAYLSNGNKHIETGFASYGTAQNAGNIVGVAFDADDQTLEFYLATSAGQTASSQGTIPTSEMDGLVDFNNLCPLVFGRNMGQTFNFGQSAFNGTDGSGTLPTGFKALNTANLADPGIDPNLGETPDEYFDSQLYTGNGGTQEISSFAFQPDWVWIKNRDNADNHYLFDSVRGATKTLHSDLSDEEITSANALQSFDSDGFTTGSDGGTNRSSQKYVAWAWKAGTSFSNDASATGVGTIDSTGKVSTEAGFSVVSYTGNGTDAATVKHGLSQKPELSIIKNRTDTGNSSWDVSFEGISGGTSLNLDTSAAVSTPGNGFHTRNTATLQLEQGSSGISRVNSSSEDYIAYCFHNVDGYCKIGTYVGNGSSDGTFIFTGFRIAWLIIKNVDFAEIWPMFDNKRDAFNISQNPLYADLSSTESAASSRGVDFLSNGFKIRGTDTSVNRSGDTHLYLAIADQPFKYSNAR
jgi:hypothetical protein